MRTKSQKRVYVFFGTLTVVGAAALALAIFALRKQTQARQDEVMASLRERAVNLQSVVDAIESYRDTHGEYPEMLNELDLQMSADSFADGRGGKLVYVREWRGLPYVLTWNHVEFLSSRLLAYTPRDVDRLGDASASAYIVKVETLPSGWTIWSDTDGSGGCGPGEC